MTGLFVVEDGLCCRMRTVYRGSLERKSPCVCRVGDVVLVPTDVVLREQVQ